MCYCNYTVSFESLWLKTHDVSVPISKSIITQRIPTLFGTLDATRMVSRWHLPAEDLVGFKARAVYGIYGRLTGNGIGFSPLTSLFICH